MKVLRNHGRIALVLILASTVSASRKALPTRSGVVTSTRAPATRIDSVGVSASMNLSSISHSLLSKSDATARVRASETYARLPLSFEANQGQADPQVKFLSRGNGYTLFLTPTEAVFTSRRKHRPGRRRQLDSELPTFVDFLKLRSLAEVEAGESDAREIKPVSETPVRMRFAGANPHAQIVGLNELHGKSNYFIGNDPRKWCTDVANYQQVEYRNIYPGIDLLYKGDQRQLEYDLLVAPGADPNYIQLAFEGTQKIEVGPDGGLMLYTANGILRQHKPLVYRIAGGTRQLVESRYLIQNGHRVSFETERYDMSQAMVIDPVLEYSTFLGGGSGNMIDSISEAVAVDSFGNAYVTGATDISTFPVTANASQPTIGGQLDVFITKLNSGGSGLLYSTFIGGNDQEEGFGVTLDSSGSAYVTGRTYSADFPVTAGAFQTSGGGTFPSAGDAFVLKLVPDGNKLAFSTYLGGNGLSLGFDIATDPSQNVYVTGKTRSGDFPVTQGALQTVFGGGTCSGFPCEDAFVAKLGPDGTNLLFSTYLGGNDSDVGLGIKVDSGSNIYVAGASFSGNFPTTQGSFQPTIKGTEQNAFVAKLNASGSSLIYSTYLGGSDGADFATGIAIDGPGNAYVCGGTSSTDFPVTAGAFQTTKSARSQDAFVTKLNNLGSNLIYSTYLGGSGGNVAEGIAIDSLGNAYVAGRTVSSNFPVTPNAVQSVFSGKSDVFFTKLNAAGDGLLFSTYLGGGGDDSLFLTYHRLYLDSTGNAFLAGTTNSPDFPTTLGAFQTGLMSDAAAFVTKISLDDYIPVFVPIILSSSGLKNSFFTSEMTLTNRGKQSTTLNFGYTAAFGEGSGTGSDTLSAGEQRIIPDAIDYLRLRGLPLPTSGNRGGTLTLSFSGLASPSDGAVSLRTTTVVPQGQAGLAYSGLPVSTALVEPSYLTGLRQNQTDRSNVAIQNVGSLTDGNIILRLTVFSGEGAAFSQVLPDQSLPPGGWAQFSGILGSLTNGYVRVERISGAAPYYAYGVINDQANSDGSFVPPILESFLAGKTKLTLPVVVEANAFSTELVVTNRSTTKKTLNCTYVADAIQTPSATATFPIEVNPSQQLILPDFVQRLRDNPSIVGIGPRGPAFAGALFVEVSSGDLSGISVSARTSSSGGGGRYGLFYTAVPNGSASATSAWIYGLQQNNENRTNIALVNTGETDTNSDIFRIELFDGDTGQPVATKDVTLNSKRWTQINSILAQYAPGTKQGYAHITRSSGSNPFIAYAVINDGGNPGERSGDGAFIASSP
jgi:hypothetical protein